MKLREFFQRYEFRRKIVHLLVGMVSLFAIGMFTKIQLMVGLLMAIIISLTFSIYTRYKKPVMILNILSYFEKPRDLMRFPGKGAVYYFVGVLASVTFFETNVAKAAIMILALGDPTAFLIAKFYGRTKLAVNKNKVLEGTLAGTFFGTLGSMFFVPLPIAFFGAAFGMMAEAIELQLNLDDNFVIPIVSGVVMTILVSLI
jgi:dolichol kinase